MKSITSINEAKTLLSELRLNILYTDEIAGLDTTNFAQFEYCQACEFMALAVNALIKAERYLIKESNGSL